MGFFAICSLEQHLLLLGNVCDWFICATSFKRKTKAQGEHCNYMQQKSLADEKASEHPELDFMQLEFASIHFT